MQKVLKTGFRTSHPLVFFGKVVVKTWSKFTGEHPCRSAISIKLLCTLAWVYGCSPVNFCIFSEKLLLRIPLDGCFCRLLQFISILNIGSTQTCIWDSVKIQNGVTFPDIVNSFWALTIFAKSSIVDVVNMPLVLQFYRTSCCIKQFWKVFYLNLCESFICMTHYLKRTLYWFFFFWIFCKIFITSFMQNTSDQNLPFKIILKGSQNKLPWKFTHSYRKWPILLKKTLSRVLSKEIVNFLQSGTPLGDFSGYIENLLIKPLVTGVH